MNSLSQVAAAVAAAAGRAAVRLVPAARREWAEALWAEAHQVPPGWPRFAWRADGVRLIAKEGQMGRGTGIALLFTAAAGAAAWGAWPGSPVSHGAAVQGGIIITLTLLAGGPLLTRWVLGPPANPVPRLPDGGGPPGPPGHSGPEPLPDPPDGGRQAEVNELVTLAGG
jgi:hypothetical protein